MWQAIGREYRCGSRVFKPAICGSRVALLWLAWSARFTGIKVRVPQSDPEKRNASSLVYLRFIPLELQWGVCSGDRQDVIRELDHGHTKQQGYPSRGRPSIRRPSRRARKEN